MRALLITIVAAGALAASPSFAQQDHAAHHPEPAASEPAAAQAVPEAAPTHEMCKSVMGHKMDPKQVHEHSREKTGVAMWPNGKPLTPAEMDKMHKTCAEKMKAAGD